MSELSPELASALIELADARLERRRFIDELRSLVEGITPSPPSILPLEELPATRSTMDRVASPLLERLRAALDSSKVRLVEKHLTRAQSLRADLGKLLDKFEFRDIDDTPKVIGDHVVWRSKFGPRKHELRVPERSLAETSWRKARLARACGDHLDHLDALAIGAPTLCAQLSNYVEATTIDAPDLDEELRLRPPDVVILGLAAWHSVGPSLDELTATCEAAAVPVILWIDHQSLLRVQALPPGGVPGHLLVLADTPATLDRLRSLGLSAPMHALAAEPLQNQASLDEAQSHQGLLHEGLLHEGPLHEAQLHRAERHHRESCSPRALFRRFAAHAGVPAVGTQARLVSVICVSHRPELMLQCFETYRRQSYPHKEFIFVANGDHLADETVERFLEDGLDVTLLRTPSSVSLGESLNRARAVARGDVWTKMDDDDHYGAEYLKDLMLAMEATGAPVVGKGTFFSFHEGRDELYLTREAPENSFSERYIHGGTILADRRKTEGVDFLPVRRGTDTLFLQQCKLLGLPIYSADRFNFAYIRYAAPGHHTFDVTHQKFLKRSELVGRGLNRTLIDA